MLSQGLSIHAAANTLDVAPSTAFRWRHRFLALAQDAKTGSLTGIVEADETFCPALQQGPAPHRAPAPSAWGQVLDARHPRRPCARSWSCVTAPGPAPTSSSDEATRRNSPLSWHPCWRRTWCCAPMAVPPCPLPRATPGSRIRRSTCRAAREPVGLGTSRTSMPIAVVSRSGCAASTAWPHFLPGQLLGLVQSARPVRVNKH